MDLKNKSKILTLKMRRRESLKTIRNQFRPNHHIRHLRPHLHRLHRLHCRRWKESLWNRNHRQQQQQHRQLLSVWISSCCICSPTRTATLSPTLLTRSIKTCLNRCPTIGSPARTTPTCLVINGNRCQASNATLERFAWAVAVLKVSVCTSSLHFSIENLILFLLLYGSRLLGSVE